MSELTMRVVNWAAQECAWQHSGEHSVAWMLEAWEYAIGNQHRAIAYDDVLRIGELVEPRNSRGIRTVPVYVGWTRLMEAELIEANLRRLIEHQPTFESLAEHPDDSRNWFKEFEEIHPFIDGNGRTGSILYNWLWRALGAPVHPPNVFGDERRVDPNPTTRAVSIRDAVDRRDRGEGGR